MKWNLHATLLFKHYNLFSAVLHSDIIILTFHKIPRVIVVEILAHSIVWVLFKCINNIVEEFLTHHLPFTLEYTRMG